MRKISRYFIAALVIFAVFCSVSVAQHWDVVTATLASSMNSLFSTGLSITFIIFGIALLFKSVFR